MLHVASLKYFLVQALASSSLLFLVIIKTLVNHTMLTRRIHSYAVNSDETAHHHRTTPANPTRTWRPQRQHNYSNKRILTISTTSGEAHGWQNHIGKKEKKIGITEHQLLENIL
jgi:hypothetical protein